MHNFTENPGNWLILRKKGDVYKRQGCDLSYDICPAETLIGDLSRVQKIYLVTGRTDMRKSFDAVSYTHLDVYKRQPNKQILLRYAQDCYGPFEFMISDIEDSYGDEMCIRDRLQYFTEHGRNEQYCIFKCIS